MISELYRIMDIYAIGRLHNLLAAVGDFLQFWRKKGGRAPLMFQHCLCGGANAEQSPENRVPGANPWLYFPCPHAILYSVCVKRTGKGGA
jgi:hypothetical protein